MPTIAETLAQAKFRHGAGDLRSAEQLYQQVLEEDPANVEASFFRGTACHALGRAQEAITSLAQAARLKPDFAEAHHHLGVVLAQNGKLDEAAVCCRHAVELKPHYADAHIDLGTVLKSQGNLTEAAACYRRALELKPNDATAHNNLGVVLMQQQELTAAEACFRQAVGLKPDYADAHANLGNSLATQGILAEAVGCYRRALQLKPHDANVQKCLGAALTNQENLADAAACYRRALELTPNDPHAHNCLGAVLQKQGRYEEAVACCRRAVELKSDYAGAHNNLAAALVSQEKFALAAASCRQALKLRPDYAEACFNLAFSLRQQGMLAEAAASYRQATELKPDFVDAHNNYAATLFLMGRLVEAWPQYEWRWKCKGVVRPSLQQPHWTGSNLAGGTILLHSEQGLGDALQFVRYAELVKQRVGTVIVECQPQLARLLASCPGVDAVLVRGEPWPKFDAWAALLSLPGIFETSLENIPAKVPYLWPDSLSVEQWKDELGHGTDFKIGIAWQGSPGYTGDSSRSIPLARFAGIAKTPGVRLFSLQMGAGREQVAEIAGGWRITDLGDRLGDFHNTAAILRNLDLVITCDSAPAHLAGALGVPVWVALTFMPDWRWMLERSDSPWYPTMRLFRQTARGDWEGVFQNIQDELVKIV